jgi:hypothetical protein
MVYHKNKIEAIMVLIAKVGFDLLAHILVPDLN